MFSDRNFHFLQARKRLVAVLQSIVTARREWRRKNTATAKKDMMDALMDAQDENGRSLKDEEIIDVLVMYLNAGHESSGHITMWATLFLHNHPDVFKRAKVWCSILVLFFYDPHQNLISSLNDQSFLTWFS